MSVTRRYLVFAVVVGIAGTVCVVAQAVLLASIVDDALLHGAGVGRVWTRLVGLAGAFVARSLCIWAGEVAAQRTSATVTSVLRRQLLNQALDLGPAWLSGQRSGELSLTAGRGIAALDTYFGRYLPQAVLAALAPLVLLVWVAAVDWISALILLGLVTLVPVAMVLFGREATRRTRRQWRRLSSLAARYLELIQGLPTLRAMGRADQGRREVAAATEGLRQATMGTLRVTFLSAFAMELIAGLGVGLVAMVLGLRLLGGSVSLSTALAVLLVSPEVFLPLRRAGAEFHASTEGQAAAARILDVLDLPSPGGPGTRSHGEIPSTAPAPDPSTGPIVLSGVGVSYPGRSEPAVADFDLTIVPGEHVAIVGPSGCGKSTLLAVLMGFVQPDHGTVRIAGSILQEVDPGAWRRRVSWVPQRPYLFRGTLEDNLRIGAPDASAASVRAAVEATGLDGFVDRLPAGLATTVGEGGLTLSAGERQRIAIARALLRPAPLVLLDEPVAHLDAATEHRIAERLAPWLENKTVLVAAHRSSLVADVDRVVSMDKGSPAGHGPPKALGVRA